MPIDVSNDVLIRCQVPSERAHWETIKQFALTIDGYKAVGQKRLAELANGCLANGRLPDGDLTALRACLFYEQRRWRHFDEVPDRNGMRHIRALVRAIRLHVVVDRKPPTRTAKRRGAGSLRTR